MKKLLIMLAFAILLAALAGFGWAGDSYDLRQYPTAGRGVVIMGNDLPPNWYLDVWINPEIVGGAQPQGPPSIRFIPHPTGQQRSLEIEIGNGMGVVTVYAIAWELDRAGNRIVRASKYPIVRYIGQLPDWNGYYWGMFIGLWELGVRWYVGSYY